MAEPDRLPDLHLTMFSQARLLAPARSLVSCFAQRLGFNEIQSGQVALAVDEALCNVINHGYGRRPDGQITLKAWDLEDTPAGLHIVIEDRARQVEPGEIRSRDLDDIRPGGLGVYIIREIMEDVVYEKRKDGGMRLSMSKHVGADQDASPAESSEATTPRGEGHDHG